MTAPIGRSADLEQASGGQDPRLVTAGPFTGWMAWTPAPDPFEELTGQYYFQRQADGVVTSAVMIERKHMNGSGAVHGGMIMAFVDFALFATAHDALKETQAVTITCNTEFVGAGREGAVMEARAEVVRETRSLVFLQGRVVQSGDIIATFSGALKKIGPRG
jgi:uncharacterized protein (TIGR00369 family)